MSNPAAAPFVTLSESARKLPVFEVTENQTFDASSTPKGTSWSVHGNLLVQWTHFCIDGEPTTPFESGSVRYILKVDTLQGQPVYEWETHLNSHNLIKDLILAEGWEVDEMCGSICASFEPLP
jgi:hypothetical protein